MSNYNNELSEKDQLIKSLRDKNGNDKKVDFDALNKSIKDKRNIFKDNSIVRKNENT